MESAAQELINRQQAKIQELTKQAETKANIMYQVYKNNIDKIKAFDIPDDYVFTTAAFRDTARSFRSAKSETSHLKTTRRKTGDKSIQLSTYRHGQDFEPLSQSVRSPMSFREGKIRQSLTSKSYHKSEVPPIRGSKESLSPIKKELSPEHPRELVMSPSHKELFQTYKKSIIFF